jgi:hypothetical protein
MLLSVRPSMSVTLKVEAEKPTRYKTDHGRQKESDPRRPAQAAEVAYLTPGDGQCRSDSLAAQTASIINDSQALQSTSTNPQRDWTIRPCPAKSVGQ